MLYSEASYFDGYHFQHIAEWYERKRFERIFANMRRHRRSERRWND